MPPSDPPQSPEVEQTLDTVNAVNAGYVAELYERAVVLGLSSDDAQHMPEPTPSPAVMEPTPDDIAGDTPGDTVAHRLRQAWDRISGNY